MVNFNSKYNRYKDYFESSLSDFFSEYLSNDTLINSAVKYSVLDGGKRIRPVLLYATAEMLNLSLSEVKNFALSIEFIHSYSLVHDDLPCMDNDDYRRGKYSTHKKFGENVGVLAGDGLLNLAVEVALRKDNFSNLDKNALKLLFEYSGVKGMIAGQMEDLSCEKKNDVGEKELYSIYLNKTAKLISAPILIASILSNYKYYEQLKEFSLNLGYLFQFIDDVMDCESNFEQMGKTPNKDADVDKLTSVKIFGIEGAKVKAKEYYDACIEILNKIESSEFLVQLTNFIYSRRS